MKYYFCKLLPPRATFPQDITAEEAKLMQQHGAYWREQMRRGYVVIFGPVADPTGGYGIAVLELPDDMPPTLLTEGDPVVMANAGFRFEIRPMPNAIHRGTATAG
jgi:hypothetical protein